MNKISNKILVLGNLVAISLTVTSTGIQTYLSENKKVTYKNIESRIIHFTENTENIVAYINETPFLTLKEAINAANTTGGTIKLADNITFNESLTISNDVIIDGDNKYTITRDSSYTKTFFTINKGAKLTIQNVTIDGNNNWTFDKEQYESDLSNGQAVDTATYVASEESSPKATAYMFINKGTLDLTNTTIKNNYSENSSGIINGSAASSATLTKTTITNCASNGGGLIASITGTDAIVYIEDGTKLNDNYAGSNGGILKIYNNSQVIMNGGEIKNNKAHNTNGIVSMTYGATSTFTLNDGLIANNSGIPGKNNGRNAAFYIHSNSKFVMNGGTIEYNEGTSSGGIDLLSGGKDIVLNGGTIQYNKTSNSSYDYKSDLSLSKDIDITLGKDMIINGNVYLQGTLTNNGTINGQVTIKVPIEQTPMINNGTIDGDVFVNYTVPTGYYLVTPYYTSGKDEPGYSNGGLAVLIGETPDISKLLIPLKEGYTFDGWYQDKELTTEYIPAPSDESIKIYAKWKEVPKEYKILEGNNNTYTKGNTSNISFTIDGDHNRFIEVLIDDVTLSTDHYTAVSGSTIVTLNSTYLENLKVGKHKITFNYNNGKAEGEFTVVELEEEIPTPPKTGDNKKNATLAVLVTTLVLVLVKLFNLKKIK